MDITAPVAPAMTAPGGGYTADQEAPATQDPGDLATAGPEGMADTAGRIALDQAQGGVS